MARLTQRDRSLNLLRKLIGTQDTSSNPAVSLVGPVATVSVTAYPGTIVPPGKSTSSIAWNTVGRLDTRRASSWNLHSHVSVQEATEWRTTDSVIQDASVSWNLSQRLSCQKSVRFNDHLKVSAYGDIRFNTLFRTIVRDWQLSCATPGDIDTPVVRPISFSGQAGKRLSNYGLDKPVVYPLSYQDYPGQTAGPGITWRTGIDPNGRVTCQKACEFNDLTDARCQRQVQWNTVQRFSVDEACLFNIYSQLTVSTIIEWNIGQGIASHIRQTAQVRTDFAY